MILQNTVTFSVTAATAITPTDTSTYYVEVNGIYCLHDPSSTPTSYKC
jgi:hypothetical protein